MSSERTPTLITIFVKSHALRASCMIHSRGYRLPLNLLNGYASILCTDTFFFIDIRYHFRTLLPRKIQYMQYVKQEKDWKEG